MHVKSISGTAAALVSACLLAAAPAPVSAAQPPTAVATLTVTSAATCQRTLPRYPDVKPGEKSAAVRTVQCLLNDAGYRIVVDGVNGRKTRTALADFFGHKPFEMAIDGSVGMNEWVALLSVNLPNRTLKVGSSGSAVVILQRALRAGSAKIAVDGRFGPATKAAVKGVQRNAGLARTGVVNWDTRQALKNGTNS